VPRPCDDDISRGSFSQGKYTGGLFVPNGIFSAPPRAGRPVESSLCVSPGYDYSGANSITFKIRVDPDGTMIVCLIARPQGELVAEIPGGDCVEGSVAVGEAESHPVTVVRFFRVGIFFEA
jgi:hypothetical protein